MRNLLLVTLLLIHVRSSFGAAIDYENPQQELLFYRQQALIANQLLKAQCPHLVDTRELNVDPATAFHIQVAKTLYNKLIAQLVKCRAEGPPKPRFTDCQAYYDQGYTTPGVYKIDPPSSNLPPFNVWCDFMDHHGWTVIQRRINQQMDFDRDWNSYKNGFGNISDEYWLGNDKIHYITLSNQKLNIHLTTKDGSAKDGFWKKFFIADETQKYKLTIDGTGHTGDLVDKFTAFHNGMNFTTSDSDNDRSDVSDCAIGNEAGWWYNVCYFVNLNRGVGNGMFWTGVNDARTSVMRVTRE